MLVSNQRNGEVDIVDWKLLGSCNLGCGHCYGPSKEEKALAISLLKKIIAKMSELRPSWVVLTGGEPLLVPRIEEVIEDINSIGAKVALSTNSSFFRRHQQTIEEGVSSLNLALDGSTPEIHALSRKDTSTYHTFFDILNHYQNKPENKPELLRIGTVYSKPNVGDLIQMATKLERFADIIDRWKIYELIDYDIQRDERAPLIFKGNEFRDGASELLEKMKSSPLFPKIMVAAANSRDKAYFMINPKGMVVIPTSMGDTSYEKSVGNILVDPLPEVLGRWKENINPGNYHGNHSHYGNEDALQGRLTEVVK